MREISDISSAHARQLRDEYPWIWLYEVEVAGSPPTRYRLTNYTSAITFGTSSVGAPLVYSPFPCVHSDIQETLDGDLPQFQIQASGASLELANVLESTVGLEGAPVVVRLVNMEDLASGIAAFEVRAEVVACKVTHERITLGIGSYNLADAVIPPKRFSRTHCNHAYGGPGCGYDLTNATLAAAFPRCAYTYDACVEHGDAEVAASLERMHPQNWGGFRNIPRR